MRRITAVLLGAAALAACTETIFVPVPTPPPAPQPSCVVAPSGLLHWWPGDGSGADIVGATNAQLVNGATFASGHVTSGNGQAFRFDGIDAMARVQDEVDLNPTGPFSVMAWAKPGPFPTRNGAIVGKGHPWGEVYVLDHIDGRWRAFLRDEDGADSRVHGPNLEPGVWTHVALKWTGQELVLLVNGESVGSAEIGTLNASSSFLGIGARSEQGFPDADLDLEFAGDIEEVAFFDRALDNGEIEAVYSAGQLGMCKP